MKLEKEEVIELIKKFEEEYNKIKMAPDMLRFFELRLKSDGLEKLLMEFANGCIFDNNDKLIQYLHENYKDVPDDGSYKLPGIPE